MELQDYLQSSAAHLLHEWQFWKSQKSEAMGSVTDAKIYWSQYTALLEKEGEVTAAKWLIDFYFSIPGKEIPNSDLRHMSAYIKKKGELERAALNNAIFFLDWCKLAESLKEYVNK